jgi:hypothetical protein
MAKRHINPPIAAGQRFGRLIAVEFVARDKSRQQRWRFRCDCGGEIIHRVSAVRCGDVRSCGCLHREAAAIQGRAKRIHGMTKSSEYNTWLNVISRCDNPSNTRWADYGGRGIKVCERWRKFENFLSDMGSKPSPKHSIERIDNDGNYEPGNCKWATTSEQSKNRRSNVWVMFDGKKMLLEEAVGLIGLSRSTGRRRLTGKK